METIKDIVKEICQIGCDNCSLKDYPEECNNLIEEYEKRIKEVIENEQT